VTGVFSIADDCPRCGLHFERIEGHWIGAIGINTIVSFGLLLVTIVVGFIATWPDPTALPILLPALIVAIGVPLFFYPLSKTTWCAVDLLMRPLDENEATPGPWRQSTPLA